MKGLFVSLEGPEGSGKSTHAALLARRLRDAGRDVVETREPGGTPVGEVVRGLLQDRTVAEPLVPEAEILLFMASRAQHIAQVIRPALARGAVVICDRFADSSTAYQGYGRGGDIGRIMEMNAWATGDLAPAVTVLLDIDVEQGFRRIAARHATDGQARDRFESETPAFHQRVRAGYLELARQWPERFRVVDSDASLDGVHQAVWAVITPFLDGVEPTS